MVRSIKILCLLLVCIVRSGFSYAQELTPSEVYDKANASVVTIYVYDFNGKIYSQGSGVVLDDSGKVVTNYHVFAGGNNIAIRHDDKLIDHINIIGVDVDKDILILKVKDLALPSLPIGDLDKLKIGQTVYAIGTPRNLSNTLSVGIISQLRSYEEDDRVKNRIQNTASISPGSSGGALLNGNGELIGITTETLKSSQNLNFAIPITDILKVETQDYNSGQVEAFTCFFKGISAYDEGDNYTDAIKNFQRAVELNSIYDEAYKYLGLSYALNGDCQIGISYLLKAIELDSLYTDAYGDLGYAYMCVGNLEEAAKNYNKAISLDSHYADAYNNLAYLYWDLKDNPDSAIVVCKEGMKQEPSYPLLYNTAGLIYEDKGMDNAAIENYKRAIETNPRYEAPYYNLVLLYLNDLKNYEEAIKYLKKIIDINPNKVEYYYSLGKAYVSVQDYTHALESLKKAIDVNPKHAKSHLLLSKVYGVMGEKKLSDFHKKTAYQLEPALKNKNKNSSSFGYDISIIKERYKKKNK